MRRVPSLLLVVSLLAVGATFALPPAAAGHEECDQYHYPELQRACLLANWWHWCLQQVWWSEPCLVLGAAAPALP